MEISEHGAETRGKGTQDMISVFKVFNVANKSRGRKALCTDSSTSCATQPVPTMSAPSSTAPPQHSAPPPDHSAPLLPSPTLRYCTAPILPQAALQPLPNLIPTAFPVMQNPATTINGMMPTSSSAMEGNANVLLMLMKQKEASRAKELAAQQLAVDQRKEEEKKRTMMMMMMMMDGSMDAETIMAMMQ